MTNRAPEPIEVTHVWYEDDQHHVRVSPGSRPLPARLAVNESWSTWLPVAALPEARQANAYARFRVRLSSGEIHASVKDATVPPIGSVAGGPIRPDDIR